jgi:hypothetical protein
MLADEWLEFCMTPSGYLQSQDKVQASTYLDHLGSDSNPTTGTPANPAGYRWSPAEHRMWLSANATQRMIDNDEKLQAR